MSLYISKVSEGLIQHVSVKKCQDEKKNIKKPPHEMNHTKVKGIHYSKSNSKSSMKKVINVYYLDVFLNSY